MPSRRDYLTGLATTGVMGLAGCSAPPMNDINVSNGGGDAISVDIEVVFLDTNEPVLSETVSIEPEESQVYEDVMDVEGEYQVTVSVDATKHEYTFSEPAAGEIKGLSVVVTSTDVEFSEMNT